MAPAVSSVPKKPVGRPEKEIDWAKVDKALEYGATGVQIAAYFGMHPETFYERIKQKYGMIFTNYAGLITPKGELDLLAKQHEQALKGNTQLLVMLGQERLGQGKKQEGLNGCTYTVHITDFSKQSDKKPSEDTPKAE